MEENMNNVNEQVEVIENNAPVYEEQNTGLTTGEKVGAIGVGAAAIIGCITVGKFVYTNGKKGLAWVKSKFKKNKEAEVPTEEPAAPPVEGGETEAK